LGTHTDADATSRFKVVATRFQSSAVADEALCGADGRTPHRRGKEAGHQPRSARTRVRAMKAEGGGPAANARELGISRQSAYRALEA
jgi:DNA invertase Pin-like site-specific DNA recombinase